MNITAKLDILKASLDGELRYDELIRTLYATDASVYREKPLAAALPKSPEDIVQLIHFANKENTSLIPRAAGTSLAGQCVGNGIVVDVSHHFNQILEVNTEEAWVRLQPGIVRDDLNRYLKPYGLFFGPNTSTANRAMIGGMVGNNSCGSYSLVYGSTRDHVLELKGFLSDGSPVHFGPLTKAQFEAKCSLDNLEGQIYRQLKKELSNPKTQKEIREGFPSPEIHRRNTGYAVDILLESEIFTEDGDTFNFCKLITGSEGTLMFITEIKIHVDPLPPAKTALLCAHFHSVDEALRATVRAMKFQPRAVELMDKIIMDCTKGQIMYEKNRFFLQGEPEGVLVIEIGGDEEEEISKGLVAIRDDFKAHGLGYAYPLIFGKEDIRKVWDLRKAGLGLLANVPGDPKAVAVIEDTAVRVQDLPEYIGKFTEIMNGFGQRSVYYAHAGAGEIHLRPILDLKKKEDVVQFKQIAHATAELVKSYNGSLSGEHGDGRVRAEFIPLMVGEDNYQLFKRLKYSWDPQNIFNPGKIVDAAPMEQFLRYDPGQDTREFDTIFDFSETGGILRLAEKCNGSGDCRKSAESGGTMCPSYQASKKEKDTTRARANTLREFLTRSQLKNPFAHEEIYEVMDLCLGCKGCTSECPSNVDMTSLRSEFLYQYYKTHGVPFRARAFAHIGRINALAGIIPGISNFFLSNPFTSSLIKKIIGFAPERAIPLLPKYSVKKWYKRQKVALDQLAMANGHKKKLFFFCDEFINYNDAHVGITALKLLAHLGYEIELIDHVESGRAYLSKGLLNSAKKLAEKNIACFKGKITIETPLVGIEPSAILSFKDEYPRLVGDDYKKEAKEIAANCLLIDDFILKEFEAGNINSGLFHQSPQKILLHGHCHQKAIADEQSSKKMLEIPENYQVEVIPSGCCGMAGSFGYEKEHYQLSMDIGELVLFPKVREEQQAILAAPGTSCRHQIKDGTARIALHPVEILWQALSRD